MELQVSSPTAELVAALVECSLRPQRKKNVRWAPGVAPPSETLLAVSITKHEVVRFPSEFVEYTVFAHQRGHPVKVLLRRYRQFSQLHAALRREGLVEDGMLPELPKKRWFQQKRWLNHWDEEYNYERRLRLQDYIRCIAKIPIVVKQSDALRKFLDLGDFPPDDEFAVDGFPMTEHPEGFAVTAPEPVVPVPRAEVAASLARAQAEAHAQAHAEASAEPLLLSSPPPSPSPRPAGTSNVWHSPPPGSPSPDSSSVASDSHHSPASSPWPQRPPAVPSPRSPSSLSSSFSSSSASSPPHSSSPVMPSSFNGNQHHQPHGPALPVKKWALEERLRLVSALEGRMHADRDKNRVRDRDEVEGKDEDMCTDKDKDNGQEQGLHPL